MGLQTPTQEYEEYSGAFKNRNGDMAAVPQMLRVGKISYLNLLPVFHSLDRITVPGHYEIIESFPSALNHMLRDGQLDVSPSSSIEYLRDKDGYGYLEGHSISSRGAVKSILLFSEVPIEEMAGHEVMSTHQSETSVALLKIILNKFHGHDCAVTTTDMPFDEAIRRHSAYLSIGDDALGALISAETINSADMPSNCNAMCSISGKPLYVYDLGDLWFAHTGLPAVFALWTYRKDLPPYKKHLLQEFKKDLDRALDYALKNLESIAASAKTHIPASEAVAFWKGITYDLPEDCIEGLKLFDKYLIETGQLTR